MSISNIWLSSLSSGVSIVFWNKGIIALIPSLNVGISNFILRSPNIVVETYSDESLYVKSRSYVDESYLTDIFPPAFIFTLGIIENETVPLIPKSIFWSLYFTLISASFKSIFPEFIILFKNLDCGVSSSSVDVEGACDELFMDDELLLCDFPPNTVTPVATELVTKREVKAYKYNLFIF